MPKRIGSGIGRIAFLAAVIVAVIAALFNNYLADYYAVIVVIQVLLGIVVAFKNVGSVEANNFLVATLALVLIAYASGLSYGLELVGYVGPFANNLISSLLLFVVPAAVIVAFKSIFAVLKN